VLTVSFYWNRISDQAAEMYVFSLLTIGMIYPSILPPLPHPLRSLNLTSQTTQANSSPHSSTPTSTPPAPSVSQSSTKKKLGSPPSQLSRSFWESKTYSTTRTQSPPRKLKHTTYSRRTGRRTSGACARLSRRILLSRSRRFVLRTTMNLPNLVSPSV
jgi:hypothetical protein